MRSGQRIGEIACLLVPLFALVELPACKQHADFGKVGDSGVGADASSRDTRRADGARAADASKICPSGTASKSKGKADDCVCDDECQTGFCVDGVCCTSACQEGCRACNLPTSLGECAFVPAGVRPGDPSVCSVSTPATCGTDGTCDGKGACRKYVQGTQCRTGTCEGDGIDGEMACDGQGQCGQASLVLCPPYTCDSSSNRCASDCTTNAQCAAGQKCTNRSCGHKLNGAKCASPSECSSGFCADGVCCNVACDGACVSCDQAGAVGRCKFVEAGQAHRACPAEDHSTCGTTGLCDGFGACAIFPEHTVCKSAVCSGDVLLSTAGTCDGMGTCREPQLVECQPFACSDGACKPSCSSDSDCAPGIACAKDGNGKLSCGKKQVGQSCKEADECASGQCVDRVCCESECAGPCRSCALPGSPGRCLSVASGAEDPRGECRDEGATSCGLNGLCDGSGTCQKYPSGQMCAPESCVDGSYTPPSLCNAVGQCVAPRSIPCNPFLCNGSSCFATCANDKQCVPGQFCQNSSCGLKPNGAACSAGGECLSGNCAQGVCCNQACSGACMACNLAGSLGLCAAVNDGAPDPQAKCKVSAPSTCGTTGACKGGACAFFDKGKSCKPAACASSSSQTPASTCDGAGACITPDNLSCGNFVCSGSACKASCASDADCVPPNTCVGNSCGLKSLGTACTAPGQCLSGHCSEGVCCDTACSDDGATGLCKSCKVTGKIGTCQPVPSGIGDPKGRCSASNPFTGDCSRDGTCNGTGACRAWSTSSGCRSASCSAGNLSLSVNCDGKGNCPAAATVSCGLYACSPTSPSCLNTCRSNNDCKGNTTCNMQTNRCGDKLPNGEQCKAGTDCSSGNCVEGTCCNSACNGACESCTVTGKVGVCSPISAGQDPRSGTSTCAKSTGACGNTGKCDGSRGCQQQVSCNDGNACTQNDSCDASGRCVGSNPVTCTALDACHTPGTCSPATGTCSNPAKTNGAACEDGNACTLGDTCQGGACVGGSPQACPASDQCHSAGTCSPSTGLCSNPSKADGTPCNDGLACSSGDVCKAGTCKGSQYSCASPGSCQQAGVCNGDGTCTFANKPDGTLCNDGNACTRNDACQAGACVGSDPLSCTAVDQCHLAGTCDSATGKCSSPLKNDGAACNDGNACTQSDTCQKGICVGANPVACTALDQCHEVGICNPTTGECSTPKKTEGAVCDDGNPCTQKDTCQSGQCVGSNPVVCSASNQCHDVGTCDSKTGQCSNPAKPDGTACSDGNACTGTDTCQAGQCLAGNAVTCTASDQCHEAGTCDPANGNCSNPAKEDGKPCDDKNECTDADACQAGACVGKNLVADGTPCGPAGSGYTCVVGVCAQHAVPDAGPL